MLPALEMVKLLPTEKQPLPIFKVLYRNSQQIQKLGGASKKTLLALHAEEHASDEHRRAAGLPPLDDRPSLS